MPSLRGIHARSGLIEREQARLGSKRACDFQPALVAVRQAAGAIVGPRSDADVVEQRERAREDVALLG